MARSQANRKTFGPPSPVSPHPALNGLGVNIVFGHNVEIRKVLMQMSAAADRFIFEPEDARHVAKQLLHFADMAEGKKTQG